MPHSKTDKIQDIDSVLREVREMMALHEQDANTFNELAILQLLLEVTRELHAISNVTELVTKVLDSALSFVGGERAFLLLLDDNGQPRFKMGRDFAGNYLSRDESTPSIGVLEQVFQAGKTLILPDALADPELGKRDSVQSLALRTVVCAPLMIKRQILGFLYVDSRSNVISHSQQAYINVFASLADQSAVAIRNAQKFETHEIN
jgi:3',5'-cyclic-nucleotide phosphodiesterase